MLYTVELYHTENLLRVDSIIVDATYDLDFALSTGVARKLWALRLLPVCLDGQLLIFCTADDLGLRGPPISLHDDFHAM